VHRIVIKYSANIITIMIVLRQICVDAQHFRYARKNGDIAWLGRGWLGGAVMCQ